KATVPLAERGFRITCLELGPRLAATARDNLASFPAVTVTEADFDTWLAPPGEAFDLVFAATAWHWTDPATRYQRAWTLLAPGGHLAFWEASHVFAVDGDPIFDDIQRLYQEIGEGLPPGAVQPRPGELPDSRAEIEASGLFADVTVRQFDWAVSYTAAEYLSLLSTFSGHIEMAPWQRDHFYQGIQRLLAARHRRPARVGAVRERDPRGQHPPGQRLIAAGRRGLAEHQPDRWPVLEITEAERQIRAMTGAERAIRGGAGPGEPGQVGLGTRPPARLGQPGGVLAEQEVGAEHRVHLGRRQPGGGRAVLGEPGRGQPERLA